MDNLNVANAASAISAMLPSEGGDQQDVELQELTEVDSAAPEEELQDSDGEQSDETEAEEEEDKPPVFTVKVDGKNVEVTLEELQKGYSREADYTRKTQQVSEERRAFQAEADLVRTERQQYSQLLGSLKAQLQQNAAPQVDMDRLYHEDPIEWVRQKEVMRERVEKVQAIQAEQQRLFQTSQREQQQALEQQLVLQKDALLAALPSWKDSKVAKAEKALVVESAKNAGFSDEDLNSVYDHRLVLLLRKAGLYDQMMSKRQGIKPVTNGPRPAKPGAAGRVSTTSESVRAKQRLAKTGRIDDAVSAIELLLK